MAKPERDDEREERITMEIVVDAYGSEERITGWHCYLGEQIQFPFQAMCVLKRSMSPLKVKDKVEVIDMADQDDCAAEMFVLIRWQGDSLAVPLSQLKPVPKTDDETKQAVADWHYWVQMGYEF
jgi:hypothetical protein